MSRTVSMNRPLRDSGNLNDGLVLRRYTSRWEAPDDRKVNPWDINEPNPTDNGTMGTIPGPVLECAVGDTIIVHFKNMDMRTFTGEPAAVHKIHSLHTHGITFSNKHDGAYPLSPPDDSDDPQNPAAKLNEITPDEADMWTSVGVIDKFKQGDRVPPGGTFTYLWNTLGWPTTAGVWLYHDHSICDMENVSLGAIGALVIHNPGDEQDVDIRRGPDDPDPAFLPKGSPNASPIINGKYVTPSKALYIQLFHNFGDAGMCINGRKYLGNTPTLLAGPTTLMRFGVIGMGMGSDAHTFHIHGHRWIMPGPHGSDPTTIQSSRMDTPVSQFEDTRIFGAANSFVFTIQEGGSNFMGAPDPIGEWHMHCHVLAHMMGGMMGSLLVVNDNQDALPLPTGITCPSMTTGGMPMDMKVDAVDDATAPARFLWSPQNLTVQRGNTVTFKNSSSEPHTVVWDTPGSPAPVIISAPNSTASVVMSNAGTFNYHCGIHGAGMAGTITVTP
jgi:plastocyanin/FtsP/CotA-like multicopper oxidase with cupredoxin domain